MTCLRVNRQCWTRCTTISREFTWCVPDISPAFRIRLSSRSPSHILDLSQSQPTRTIRFDHRSTQLRDVRITGIDIGTIYHGVLSLALSVLIKYFRNFNVHSKTYTSISSFVYRMEINRKLTNKRTKKIADELVNRIYHPAIREAICDPLIYKSWYNIYASVAIMLLINIRKLCYRKDDRAMRPIGLHGARKSSWLPDYAHG